MTTPAADASKSAWRAWARGVRQDVAKRNTRGGSAVHDTSRVIVAHLRSWHLYHRSNHVLLYLPLAGEVDLTALLQEEAKTFYLTRTWLEPTQELSLHAYDPTALERHPYGFDQPLPSAERVPPSRIDLALVPGLAFDAAGTRLGFGRGYFDRLLSTLPAHTPKVGVATSAMLVPRLPSEEHDVPMDYLATESGLRAIIHPDEREPA